MWSARCRWRGRGARARRGGGDPGPGLDPPRCASRGRDAAATPLRLALALLLTLEAVSLDAAEPLAGLRPTRTPALDAEGNWTGFDVAAAAPNITAMFKPPCSQEMSVALDGRKQLRSDKAIVMLDGNEVYWPGSYYVTDNFEVRGCPCELATCFFKCCPEGQVMLWAKELSRKDCVRRSSWRSEVPEGAAGSLELPELLLDLYAEDNLKEATQSGVPVPAHWRTMVAERDNQTKGVFKLNQTHDPDDRFYLLEKNASLVVPNYAHSIFAPGTFCIDVFLVVRAGAGGPEGRWSVSAELSAIVPFVEDEEELAVSAIVSILYPVGLLISIPFLVATFAVYCSYSELRNLPGKSLMCYTASMIAGYLCLALVQFNVVVSNMVCVLLGFFLHFAFLACFFWLNVMCFDIWRTFSVFRGAQHSSGRSGELRRFLLYSLYAWGSPLLLLGVTVLGQLFAGRWHIINPAMGENSCYFGTTVAKYAYFCAPVAVLLLVNLCLFLHTAVRIVQLQRETSALKSAESQRHSAERQRYHVYLKLFLIMGVNWVAEIISNLFPEPSYLWMLSDVTNSLQGILIFILFVGTGRVRRIVLRRGVTHNTSSYATKTSRLTATMGNGNGAVCNGASRASMVGPGPGPGVLEPASPETTVSPTLASPEATESPALASSAATMSPAHLDPVSPAAAEAGAVPSVAPFPSSRSPPAPAPAPPAGAASAARCVDEDMEDIALMDLTAGARPVPTSPCGGPSLPLATTTAETLAEENVSSPRALPDCVLDSLKTVGGVPRAVEGNGRTGLEPAVARSQIPMSVVPDR